jgi:hypothetical protein
MPHPALWNACKPRAVGWDEQRESQLFCRPCWVLFHSTQPTFLHAGRGLQPRSNVSAMPELHGYL